MFGYFTEKAKWRNIRKNHKRTSGIEHILKYYNITKGFMWYSYWIRFKGKNHFETCNSCIQCTKLIFDIYEKSCESLMPSISLPNGQNSLSEIFNIQGSFTEYYNIICNTNSRKAPFSAIETLIACQLIWWLHVEFFFTEL